jgi:ArsR family transcriptional regulator, lead/cadmium/zinc/bismuth-responsive transcriptional repressor
VSPVVRDWEVRCAKCNNYYPLTEVFSYHNGYYCKKCYKSVNGLQSDPTMSIKCKMCGKAIAPEETMVRNGIAYCISCYYRGLLPNAREEMTQELARSLTKAYGETKCDSCGKVLTDFDHKVQDGGKFYCKSCYNKTPDTPSYGFVNKSGFLPRRPVTTVSDTAVLFECTSCGMILTPDRLKEDKDGRVICPKCSSVLPIRVHVADKGKNLKDIDYAPTAQLFKCLGDPCRVKIIELLSQNELCVYEVVEMTGFQYSAISYHLKMLKGLGLVRSAEKGNFMVYSLTEKGSTVHEFVEKSKSLS